MTKAAEITIHLQSGEEMLLPSNASFPNKRRLTEEAEDVVVEEARALPRNVPLRLQIHIPTTDAKRADEIVSAIQMHFAACRQKSKRHLKQTFHSGWRSLLIGFLFLCIMYFISEAGRRVLPDGGTVRAIHESLTILGWAALWRPAELLLYEWIPFKRDAVLFGRLEESETDAGIKTA